MKSGFAPSVYFVNRQVCISFCLHQPVSFANLQAFSHPHSSSEQQKTTFFGKWFRCSSGLRGSNPPPQPWQGCALPNELNPHITDRIVRSECLRSESNQRHGNFQSPALPTELQRRKLNNILCTLTLENFSQEKFSVGVSAVVPMWYSSYTPGAT